MGGCTLHSELTVIMPSFTQRCIGGVAWLAEGLAKAVGTLASIWKEAKRKSDVLYEHTHGEEDILREEPPEKRPKVDHKPPSVVGCRFCSLGFPDEEKKQKHESVCPGNRDYLLQCVERSKETPQKPGETDQEHMGRCIDLTHEPAHDNLTEARDNVHDATCELRVHLATPVDGEAGPIHPEEYTPKCIRAFGPKELEAFIASRDAEFRDLYENRRGFFVTNNEAAIFVLTMLKQREECKKPCAVCQTPPNCEAREQEARRKALESFRKTHPKS